MDTKKLIVSVCAVLCLLALFSCRTQNQQEERLRITASGILEGGDEAPYSIVRQIGTDKYSTYFIIEERGFSAVYKSLDAYTGKKVTIIGYEIERNKNGNVTIGITDVKARQ